MLLHLRTCDALNDHCAKVKVDWTATPTVHTFTTTNTVATTVYYY